jgi:hypothetical protein
MRCGISPIILVAEIDSTATTSQQAYASHVLPSIPKLSYTGTVLVTRRCLGEHLCTNCMIDIVGAGISPEYCANNEYLNVVSERESSEIHRSSASVHKRLGHLADFVYANYFNESDTVCHM